MTLCVLNIFIVRRISQRVMNDDLDDKPMQRAFFFAVLLSMQLNSHTTVNVNSDDVDNDNDNDDNERRCWLRIFFLSAKTLLGNVDI